MVQFSCLIAGRIRDILACDRANLSHTFVTHLWLDNIGIVAWHLTDVDGSCDRRSCVFVSSSTRRCTDISTGNFKMTIPLQRFRQIRFFSNALLNVDSNCLTYLDYAHMTTTCNLCQIFVRCWILRCNVLHFFTACSDSEDRPLDTSCRLPWSVVPLKLHDTSSNILNHLRLSLRQVLTECFLIDQSLVKWFVRFISDLSHWKIECEILSSVNHQNFFFHRESSTLLKTNIAFISNLRSYFIVKQSSRYASFLFELIQLMYWRKYLWIIKRDFVSSDQDISSNEIQYFQGSNSVFLCSATSVNTTSFLRHVSLDLLYFFVGWSENGHHVNPHSSWFGLFQSERTSETFTDRRRSKWYHWRGRRHKSNTYVMCDEIEDRWFRGYLRVVEERNKTHSIDDVWKKWSVSSRRHGSE